MSIVNIVLSTERAVIATDTNAAYMATDQMTEEQRQGRHTFKMSVLPQIDAAMASRGDALLAAIVHLNLEIACPRDFDHAVQFIPALLTAAYLQATDSRKQAYGIEELPGAEVVFVGWSPSLKRFAAVHWVRRPEASVFTETRVDGMLLLPEIDRMEPVERPDTDAAMEALMRRQIDWAAKVCPQYPCGGRLLMTELTRGAINVRTIADLG